MIVSASRQVADWLSDAATGVNVQLNSVPGDASDVRPPNVTVWDATRFEWVAKGVVPRDRTGALPLLLIHVPQEQQVTAWAGDDTAGWVPVTVIVDYVRRPELTATSDFVVTHALQTLRAAVRALQAQYQTADTRVRNGVDLSRPAYRIVAEQQKLAGEELILATLEVTLGAFDPWVMGATISSS